MCHLASLWERRHHYEHALSGKGSGDRQAVWPVTPFPHAIHKSPESSQELAFPPSLSQVFRGSPPVPLCSLLVCKSNKEMLNPETQGDMSKVVIFQYCDGSPVPVC